MAKVTLVIEDVETEEGVNTIKMSKTSDNPDKSESIAEMMVEQLYALVLASAASIRAIGSSEELSDEPSTDKDKLN